MTQSAMSANFDIKSSILAFLKMVLESVEGLKKPFLSFYKNSFDIFTGTMTTATTTHIP